MNRSRLRRGLFLTALVLACFGLSPQARAVCQEGCDGNNNNTFLGDDALINNTTGNSNTAIGLDALFSNTIGSDNTAIGFNALENNTTGISNIAIGAFALGNNTTSISNIAIGAFALGNNTTGDSNIALGVQAALQLGTGSNNIDIGSDARGRGESRTIRIGTIPTHMRTFVAGISGVTVAGGVGVIVDTNGQLGTVVSSERFKAEIKPMDKTSEAILRLKPVNFHYKHELDPKDIPQFGLVAEDLEKVNRDLVARDEQGKPYSVRYEAVNAMLLNEFLKAHRRIEEQDRRIDQLTAQLKEQAAQIQKVSAQLQLSKAAPQTVQNAQ
jgi:hypothetical protein